jgi:exonuclease III
LITTASVFIAVGFSPASAATPSKVDPVTFTGAGLANGAASLTVSWPTTANATRYEVLVSTSYDGVLKAPVNRTVSTTHATIGGLRPGTDYFVVVRGTNGSSKGSLSSRVGHSTILSQGAGDGPTYSVLTYNLCSQVESCIKSHPWEPRRAGVLSVIAAQHPDVLTLQESASLTRSDAGAVPGYTRVAYYSSKTLLLRTGRFSVVPIPGGTPSTKEGLLESCAPAADLRVGCIDMGGRYAVWAEVHDPQADAVGNVIFVDVHQSPGTDRTAVEKRRLETTKLVAGIAAINPNGLPVIMGGDFNSHKHRADDSTGTVLHSAGYTDGYDLAESLTQQHHNSYNDWKTTPIFSYTWGDHIDHVWVQAGRTRVTSWANVAPLENGKYVAPLSSDHNPVLVRVQVSRSERLAGVDRYNTAVTVSHRAFPTGAPVVYVAGGIGFADGLSGGPRAAKDRGPLLLVPGQSTTPSSVTAEIKRLNPGRIVVLGGPASISTGVVTALDTIAPVTRISGDDRYATAATAATAWSTADTVYLASGEAFPDALSGSALAASQGAPLLLTRDRELPSASADALDRLKPSRIVIVGGPAAVSDRIEETLAERDGVTVSRVAGDDRYATSVKALAASGALASGRFIGASGANFPDALAGTPAAHKIGAGFALTRSGCVPDALADALGAQKISESFVLGGTAALGRDALTDRCD